MKSGAVLLLTVFLWLGSVVNAQDCPMYFPDKVGATREMKFYDQRDRLTSITRHEILDKTESGNSVSVKVRATSYDKDDEEIHNGELELICEDGVFIFDLTANLSAGDVLPDGNLTMVVKSGSTTIITINLSIFNRKVEGVEDITTDAGTFSSYKVSYDISTKAGFLTSSSSAIEWMAEGVGLVRSETYNRRGRLTGYSVLTGYSN